LREADCAFHLEQWQDAVAAYDAVVKAGGEHAPTALFWLGVSQERAGDEAAALATLQRLIDQHPEHPRAGDAWLRIAGLRVAQGDSEGAMAAYAKAAEVIEDPARRQQAQVALTWAKYQQSQSPDVLTDLETLVRNEPASALAGDLALRIGRVHFDAERYEQAAEMLSLLLEHHPEGANVADATYLLAAAHERLGNADQAERLYEQLAENTEAGGSAGYATAALVGIHAENGRIDQARQLIDRMEKQDADAASLGFALYRTAEALRHAEKPQEALPLYQRAIQVAPEADSAAFSRAGAGWCRLDDDPGAALADFRAVLEDSPESGAVSLAMDGMLAAAQKLFDDEKYAEAAEVYAEIVAAFPESAAAGSAQYGQAWALLRQDRPDEALALFGAAAGSLEAGPMATDARYQAARLLAEDEEYARAADLLRPLQGAEQEGERLPWALTLLGRCELERGEAQTAAEVLANALKRWPEHAAAPGASLSLGRAYRALDRSSDALEPLRRASEADSASVAAQAQFELAGAMRDGGDAAGAAEEFLKVAILYPDSEWAPEAQFAAGQCYEELDQADSARRSYQVIVDRYADTGDWAAKAQQRLEALEQ
ncbi:MAG: tetratricopeptide repeat protein, partial [Armatimonadia bacterium]|nr:tetratricopeptide repeat protein [Armatimonadia bacterium]